MLTRFKPQRGVAKVAAIFLSVALLTACSKKSAEDYIHDAQKQRESGNISAAIIDLKNALQLEPKSQQARLLLARFYLDVPDPASAEGELLHAKQNGVKPALLAEPLAEAKLMLGQPTESLKETELPAVDSPEPKASLLGIRAEALMALGRMNDAHQALEDGLMENPHSVIALTAMIRYALATNNIGDARKFLALGQKEQPKNATLFLLQGAIAFATGDYAAAETAYEQMGKSAPWNLTARINLARAQIAQNKAKEANANITFVLKAVPNNPMANYVGAVIAYRQGQYNDAQAHVQRVVTAAPNFAPAILLAGATSYALKQYEQANSYLGQYLYRVPGNVQARKLLAATQVALGHSGEAVQTLLPAVNSTSDDAQLLAMIGEASARSGDLTAANRYFAEAVTKQPENAALRTQLGITRVALGETQAGIGDLERAAQQDPTAIPTETALFLEYMRNKEFDKAKAVGQHLVEAHPKEPIGYDYTGLALLAQNNEAAARKALLTARDLKPGDAMASRALASLAVRDKNFALASQYYEEILKANSKDVQAYFALATLEQQAGHADKVEGTLQKAVGENPDSTDARLILGRYQLLQNKFGDALNTIGPALTSAPRNPALLEVAGRAELGAKNPQSAVEYFKTLVEVQPGTATAHRYLAEAYAGTGKIDLAVSEATKAIDINKSDPASQILLARIYMTKQDYATARKLVDELATSRPKDADVAELQGDIAMEQGRPNDAVAAFQRGLSIADNNVFRSRLATAEAQAGHIEQAEKTLLPWIELHPDDAVARIAMGAIYVSANRAADAETQYTAILKKNPNNALAENNLAWTLSQLGKNAEALKHAEHAATLAPRSAQVLDTLGVVQMKSGKPEEAMTTLQKAVASGTPASLEIRFHLAQALAAVGKKADARDSLRAMLATDKPFEERDEAQKLLNQLGG